MKSALVLITAVAAMTCWTADNASAESSGQLSPKQKAAERKAISAFAAGEYSEAVGIYAELYADYREAFYLRNIGRCYQKMKNAPKALAAFEEYLNQAKDIGDEEKKEILGYMDEMRALSSPPAVPPPAPPPPPEPEKKPEVQAGPVMYPSQPGGEPQVQAPPVYLPQDATRAQQPQPFDPNAVNLQVSAQPAPDNTAIRQVGVGALILSGVSLVGSGSLLLASWLTYNKNKDGKCLGPDPNKCSDAADRIDSLNLWSGITLGLAVASAATGGALLYFYPASPSTGGLKAGVAWTY